MDRGRDADPNETEPIEPKPIDTEPTVAEPIATEPIVAEPIATEPIATAEPSAFVRPAVGPDDEGPKSGGPERGHRKRPGIWFPVIIFVVLLAAGAAVGRYVVPAGAPAGGSEPPVQAVPSGQAGRTDAPPATEAPVLPTTPLRPADQLAAWAEKISTTVDVPVVAIQAYGYAQLSLRQIDPGCNLTWTTLAGIAEVESRHGQAGGAVLELTGRSSPPITGPLLDGKGGRALVRDSDAGAFDGDSTFDRAMGPMLLMPSAWRAHAIDADSDGIVDPFDLDDAALTMGRLLCSGSEDMASRNGWNAAVAQFREGTRYIRSVFDAADSYGQRTRHIV
jgi:hypothetical protein